MRICAFDSETRGLWGEIFKVGFFDSENYHTFNSGLEFLKFVISEYPNEELNIYGFNLEFDFAKILKETIISKNKKKGKESLFEVDFNKSLVINGKFHVVKLMGKEIYFRDIYPLVNTSLEKACKDFELSTKKVKLKIPDGMSTDQYFLGVSPDDAGLLEYLKADVMATYQLVQTIKTLSGLEDKKFVRCPTVASLSMKIFKTDHPHQFNLMKETSLLKEHEDFVRQAYCGGRVEIFKPRLTGGGYHYDINSLYPAVMEKNEYPIGRVCVTKKAATQEEKQKLFHTLQKDDYKHFPYIVFCRVKIPYQKIGPLPVRACGKLIFPVGMVNGHFCRPELDYAIKHCGVQVLEIYTMYWWMETAPVFKDFIATQKKVKMTSKGAKRNFAKLIQNSNYGKWGMQRLRISYENFEQEKFDKIKARGDLAAVVQTGLNECMVYNKLIFADYILPHYSCFITSFARLELLKAMKATEERGDNVFYCDTDSIVCKEEMEKDVIDDNEYGLWKLEREIDEAIFVLPKLYAEREKGSGKEVLKSKGLVKSYKETITYKDYEAYYEALKNKTDYVLYGYGGINNYYTRYNIIEAIKRCKDVDTMVLLRKALCFSSMFFKRDYDHVNNDSSPLVMHEPSLIVDN